MRFSVLVRPRRQLGPTTLAPRVAHLCGWTRAHSQKRTESKWLLFEKRRKNFGSWSVRSTIAALATDALELDENLAMMARVTTLAKAHRPPMCGQ
jgi:hypothetical protein